MPAAAMLKSQLPPQQWKDQLEEILPAQGGLWGQLLLILHGFALLGAGAAISLIGVTEVFVPEDLAFMDTSAEVPGAGTVFAGIGAAQRILWASGFPVGLNLGQRKENRAATTSKPRRSLPRGFSELLSELCIQKFAKVRGQKLAIARLSSASGYAKVGANLVNF
jgi:hypothetical protein